jgi:HSP20 family protein
VTRARKRAPGARDRDTSEQPERILDLGSNLGGFLGKLGGLIERLGELTEGGEEFVRSGEIKGSGGKVRGVYGFSVKTGLGRDGEQELKVEPFGNIHREPTGERVVEDVREPLVDVYEEDDHVLVLVEIPGVSKKDVQLDLRKDRLILRARRREKSYRKEVALPGEFSADKMHWDCANGILKIRLER